MLLISNELRPSCVTNYSLDNSSKSKNGKWIHFQFMGHWHWPLIALVTPPRSGQMKSFPIHGPLALAINCPGYTAQIWAVSSLPIYGPSALAINCPGNTPQIWAMTSLPIHGPVIANSMPIAYCPDLGGVTRAINGQLGIAHSKGLGACAVGQVPHDATTSTEAHVEHDGGFFVLGYALEHSVRGHGR